MFTRARLMRAGRTRLSFEMPRRECLFYLTDTCHADEGAPLFTLDLKQEKKK